MISDRRIHELALKLFDQDKLSSDRDSDDRKILRTDKSPAINTDKIVADPDTNEFT